MKNLIPDQLIYNVTIKVEGAVAALWLQWMLDEHIPEVLATKCFYRHQVVKLLDSDDSEGPTYAVQYYAHSRADYDKYIEMHASALREKTLEKWGARLIAFRSLMQIVQ